MLISYSTCVSLPAAHMKQNVLMVKIFGMIQVESQLLEER